MFFGLSFLVNACALAKKVVTLHLLFGVTDDGKKSCPLCCARTIKQI